MRHVPCRGIAALAIALAASMVAAPVLHAGEEPSRKSLALSEVAPALEAKDLDGGVWRLADARLVTPETALEGVLAAARKLGATEQKATDEIGTSPAFQAGDAKDPAKVAALARAVGGPLGLVADETTVAGWKTFADAAAWVVAGAKAPLVLVCWSPSCPTSKLYEPRLVEIAARTGARMVLIASNATDSVEASRARVTEVKLPFRVLVDADQRLTDVLGGRRTPHVFVLDATGALRYAGGIDDDSTSAKEEGNRATWLRDAVVSLTEGRAPNVLLTTPKG